MPQLLGCNTLHEYWPGVVITSAIVDSQNHRRVGLSPHRIAVLQELPYLLEFPLATKEVCSVTSDTKYREEWRPQVHTQSSMILSYSE